MCQSSYYQTSVALVPRIASIFASLRVLYDILNPIIYTTIIMFYQHLNKGLYSCSSHGFECFCLGYGPPRTEDVQVAESVARIKMIAHITNFDELPWWGYRFLHRLRIYQSHFTTVLFGDGKQLTLSITGQPCWQSYV